MPKADLQYQARNDAQGDRMRHFQWGALGASSLMALVGIVSRFETDSIENEKREVQWVVSATSIVLAVATFSIVCHFAARQAYVGSFLEGGLVSLKRRRRCCLRISYSDHVKNNLPL